MNPIKAKGRFIKGARNLGSNDHSVPVIAARRDIFMPAAEGLEFPDHLGRPARLDVRLDLLERPVPLLLVRQDRLHVVGRVLDDMLPLPNSA